MTTSEMKMDWECGNVTTMPGNMFFMLGVIHRDKYGPVLLKYWLDRIQPDSITLELSHYGMRFRRNFSEEYTRRIDKIIVNRKEKGEPCNEEVMASLLSYVRMPYEYDVVSDYGTEHSIPFYLIDMDFFSYVKLRNIEDLLSEENIDRMFSFPELQNGNLEMTTARLYFEKGIALTRYGKEMYIRDRYMSTKIQDLMKHSNKKRLVHVCGWQHLQDPSGLYNALNPIKVFFHDKTVCI